jgi:uncharacterized protein (TIGR03067 family)
MHTSRAITGLLLLIAVGCVLPVASQGQERAEKPRLTGTWTGWVVDGRGERPNEGVSKITEMVITDKTIRAHDDQRDMGEGSYRIGRDQGWGTLDATGTAGPTRGRTFGGIYQLDGNTLRWCTSQPGRGRPTELMTRRGNGQYLMVLKRVPARQ